MMTNSTTPHVLDAKGRCPQGCDYARDGDTHWPHRYDDDLYRGGCFKLRWPKWCVRWIRRALGGTP